MSAQQKQMRDMPMNMPRKAFLEKIICSGKTHSKYGGSSYQIKVGWKGKLGVLACWPLLLTGHFIYPIATFTDLSPAAAVFLSSYQNSMSLGIQHG